MSPTYRLDAVFTTALAAETAVLVLVMVLVAWAIGKREARRGRARRRTAGRARAAALGRGALGVLAAASAVYAPLTYAAYRRASAAHGGQTSTVAEVGSSSPVTLRRRTRARSWWRLSRHEVRSD